ncbi:uncharacterized protein SCDLUD_001084 [Saccharomycodes ludwigii]|uniref:uncharacterized protein n=1 Tax=Saccharomycodes ludwigii TaxID=36035 RepID=UPI001E84F1E0|nr:hypothetical protein SCDLUD_001084 [Saccharomycodes ludwigii]KAH3903444.1 hypothetical protein SCDLUD_001084 [Saccharomycodes ludwigii]
MDSNTTLLYDYEHEKELEINNKLSNTYKSDFSDLDALDSSEYDSEWEFSEQDDCCTDASEDLNQVIATSDNNIIGVEISEHMLNSDKINMMKGLILGSIFGAMFASYVAPLISKIINKN